DGRGPNVHTSYLSCSPSAIFPQAFLSPPPVLSPYIKHGFVGTSNGTDRTTTFMSDSISSYARSALPSVFDAHRVVQGATIREDVDDGGHLEGYLRKIQELDELYNVMPSNHVTMCASKSQGVALLTLYTKGFSIPSSSTSTSTMTVQDPRAS
ncbi:hypothetical protein C8J55DRAFT_586921, partial [Lentinula edodes]